jgi:hypothetical protein
MAAGRLSVGEGWVAIRMVHDHLGALGSGATAVEP